MHSMGGFILKHNFRSVSFLSQAIRSVWMLKCFLGLIPNASSCPGVLKVSSTGAEVMGMRKRCSPSSQATATSVSGKSVLCSGASQVPAAFSSCYKTRSIFLMLQQGML